MAIFFFNEEIDFILKEKDRTVQWLSSILTGEGYKPENVNYIFCSDEYIHQINLEYLDHDTYTDIITFDNSEDEQRIEADIFISIDRVRENADAQKILFTEELHRVMIHGLLHIMGYSDKTAAEQQVMREKEDACLSLR